MVNPEKTLENCILMLQRIQEDSLNTPEYPPRGRRDPDAAYK